MKIVILGAGQVGSSTAEILAAEDHDVSLVDLDDSVLSNVRNRLDIQTVRGNCMFPEVLLEAGAEDAELIMAVTTSDEVNMVACQIAHTLFTTPNKVARIRAPSFLANRDIFNDKSIPIDSIISPEEIVTRQVVRLIEHPGALQVLDFADGKIQLVAIRAEANSPIVNHQIKDLRNHLQGIDSRVAAIYRGDSSVPADGDTVVQADDEVFFVAAREHIKAVMRELHSEVKPTRRVMIAGAGNIGLRLAKAIEKRKYTCKVIERHEARAEEVSELLDDTLVLHGDAADEEMLREENIESFDVFCSVTNDDEANILSAMLAKRLGVGTVIALVNRSSYTELIEETGVDIAIAPRTATVGTLLTTIRRGDMVAVHSLRNGAAEAIEVIAHGDPTTSRVVGRSVGEIDLPSGTKIGALLRNDEVVIAHDNIEIQENDHLILFVTDKQHIREVEQLFSVSPLSI